MQTVDMIISMVSHPVIVRRRLVKIANQTNRYMLCECGQGLFEVLDSRRLLDSLVKWQAVLPFDVETGLSDFEKLLAHSGKGPELNKADEGMLHWLMVNACAHEDEADAFYYGGLCQAATVFEGNEAEMTGFLLGKLYLKL
jgi:hypothetical protein